MRSERLGIMVFPIALALLAQTPQIEDKPKEELLQVVRDFELQVSSIRFHFVGNYRYLEVGGPDPNDPSKPRLTPRQDSSTGLFQRVGNAYRVAYVSTNDKVASIAMSDGKHAAMYREDSKRGSWDDVHVMPSVVPFMKFLGVPSAQESEWMKAKTLEDAVVKSTVTSVSRHSDRAVYRLDGLVNPCFVTVDPRHEGCITKVSFQMAEKGVELIEEWTLENYAAIGKKKRVPTKFTSLQRYTDKGTVFTDDRRVWSLTGVSDKVTREEVLKPLPNGVRFFTFAGEKSVEVPSPRWSSGDKDG